MSINWKGGITPVSELTLENFPGFAEDYAQFAYQLCFKATMNEKEAIAKSAAALAAVACQESGKPGSDKLMPEEAIKRVLLDVLSKQQLVRLNSDEFQTIKTPSQEALDIIVRRAVEVTNAEMPRYARVFSGTKGSLVIIGLVVMLLAAIVLIWVNPFACSGTDKVILMGKTGDVSAAARPDADMLVGVTFDDSGAEKINSGAYPVLFTLDGPDSRAVTGISVLDSDGNSVDVYPCGEERYCFIVTASDVYQAVISGPTGERPAYHIVPEVVCSSSDAQSYVVSHNYTAEIVLDYGQSILTPPVLGRFDETPLGLSYVPSSSADGIGLDTFSYTEADGTVITVPVLVCNSSPYIEPDSLRAEVLHTPSRSGMYAGVIRSSDADGDTVTFELVDTDGCNVVLSPNGSYFALIDSGYRLGEAGFSFTVSDGIAVSDPYHVTITLKNNLIQPAEISHDFVCYAGEDGYYTFELPAVDDDGDALTWTLVTDNVNGVTTLWNSRVSVTNGNLVSYRIDPALDERFVEALTFSCSDGWANGTLMTVICNNRENLAPVSSGNNAAAIASGSSAVLEVTVNDDCPFDRCRIIAVEGVEGGTVREGEGWEQMKFTFTHDGESEKGSVAVTVADTLTGKTARIVYDINIA